MKSKVFEFSDYRGLLKHELVERLARNPRYSQGSFAKDLGLSPNRLSELLSGKQGLSAKVADQLATRLGFSEKEKEFFCCLVDSQHARSPVKRAAASSALAKMKTASGNLELDRFRLISEWYCLAIVELAKLKDFRWDVKWIAKKLKLNVSAVKLAIDSLERCGLIHKSNSDQYFLSESDYYVYGGVSSAAIKKFHDRLIDKAKIALHEQEVDEKHYESLVLAIDSRRLTEFKDRIQALFDEFGSDSTKSNDQLYCLSTQFFRLSAKE